MILQTSNYPIEFYEKFQDFQSNFSFHEKTFFLFDKNFHEKWKEKFTFIPNEQILVIPSGEEYKNIKTLQKIWEFLCRKEADRKSVLVCIGGGVVGDMGGFAAATYMRGIPFIQVPTTLLSMVDASVGGKTAIDFLNFKNIIGAFYFPQKVIICHEFLYTLPERHIDAGKAEMFKHAMIYDKKHLMDLLIITLNSIYRSVEIKNYFVEKDPYEKDIRKALNFGHTLGHAFESYALKMGKDLLHGEAVWLGMYFEMVYFYKMNWVSDEVFNEFQTEIQFHSYMDSWFFNSEFFKESIEFVIMDKKRMNHEIVLPVITKLGKFELKNVNIDDFLVFFKNLYS